MIDLQFCEAVVSYLATSFPQRSVYAANSARELNAPAIVVDIRAEVVVGSMLEQGTLTVIVISQADDTTPGQHQADCNAIDAAIRSMKPYFATGPIALYGVIAQNTDNQRENTSWEKHLVYLTGYGPRS